MTTVSTPSPAIKRRVVDSWEILGVQIVRFECLHEFANFNHVCGWPRPEMFVIYDHTGKQALDAAANFLGHGFEKVRCLRGGIDAWAQEVDPKLPRYKLG